MKKVIIENIVNKIACKPERELPENTTIRFEINGISYSVRVYENGINIHKVGDRGDDRINIIPLTANDILIN